MNHHIERLKISRSAIASIVIGILGISAVFMVRAVHPPLTAGERELRNLIEQADKLDAYDDHALERSKNASAAAARALWSDDTVAAWRQRLPAKWTSSEYGLNDGVRTVGHRFLITRNDASSRDYPEILEVLRSCSSLIGGRVENITIASTDHRHFDQVQILVSLSYPKK